MPLEYMTYFSRVVIKSNRDKLFVFGDNLARKGYGGQAKEARGEPNAVGIPTKRVPSYAENAYLCDDDFAEWEEASRPDMYRIENWLGGGYTVVWPEAGIGTGLACLPICAPKIYQAIKAWEARIGARNYLAPEVAGKRSIEDVKSEIMNRVQQTDIAEHIPISYKP